MARAPLEGQLGNAEGEKREGLGRAWTQTTGASSTTCKDFKEEGLGFSVGELKGFPLLFPAPYVWTQTWIRVLN